MVKRFWLSTFADNRNRMWKTHWHKPNDYEQSFLLTECIDGGKEYGKHSCDW